MTREELVSFLKENLKVDVWCDYDGCSSPQVNINLMLCGEIICKSQDYLLRVD